MTIRLWFLLIFILPTGFKILGQQPNTLPKNEFGLTVIVSKNDYLQSVALDSSKKMVALHAFLSPFLVEFVYATKQNFTHKKLYKKPIAFLRLPAANALKNVCTELETMGLGIKIWDAYRPYSITKEMWKIVADERYTANPAKGSGHNRGAAVDITLINLKTKKELKMPTAFDDFSEKAHHNYEQLDAEIKQNRQLLKTIMEKNGFLALDTEWWHYYLPQAASRFELLDIDFAELKKWTSLKNKTE